MTPVIKIIHKDEVVQGEFRLTHSESNEEAADSMLINVYTGFAADVSSLWG